MRQKEVMGQSIRTSKSARPGTITYVPIDKSEFRSTVSSEKKKNKKPAVISKQKLKIKKSRTKI